MRFVVIKGRDTVSLIRAVRENADSDKDALGFIPESAYSQAAVSGKLLVVTAECADSNDVVGHLLYGGTFPHIHVYQVYVTPPYRRRRVASLLVDSLIRDAEESSYLSVSARVATDLGAANAFWESAGLRVVRQKAGGTSRNRVLNIRVRELDTPRLFEMRYDVASPLPPTLPARVLVTVPSYIIDVNVFLDLMKRRAKAGDVRRIFSAAWTRSVDVFVAEEFIEELTRASKPNESDPVLEMALTIPRLPMLSNSVIESIVARLAPIVFPHKTEHGSIGSHDASDLRHLAAVVHHGMNGFVTSEKAILKRGLELRLAFGIDIVGTEEFANLAAPDGPTTGKDFRSGSGGDDLLISELVEDHRERALAFLRSLHVSESAVCAALSPGADTMRRRRVEVISGFSDELVGYASWDPSTRLKNHVDAHVFVDEDHPDAQPVAAHLLRELAQDASSTGPCLIALSIAPGHVRTRAAALEAGFRVLAGSEGSPDLRKIAIGGIITSANWGQVSERLKALSDLELIPRIPTYQGPETQVPLKSPSGQESVLSIVEVEKLFGPAIFLLPGRSGILVPIRRQYAEHLFSGSPQMSLLPRKHAALFTERAYFRDPTRSGAFKVGTPVLFYESAGGKGRGCLFASATVTSNRVVWAETISDRVLLKGVLDRADLTKRSKDGLISVMHFDNTMILKKPVGLTRLRALHAVDGANLVAPRCLDMDTVSSLFAEADVLAL